ncbi:PIG-L deacetylase family protein [Nanoarchaeota archaeon]
MVKKVVKSSNKVITEGKRRFRLKKDEKKEVILVFCAHNDDHIIGMGGTIAKWTNEGKIVMPIVFTYGENTHPWLKKGVVVGMRARESEKADDVLGCDRSIYLGIKDSVFQKEFKKKNVISTIKKMVEYYRPVKIFTHSDSDPHPDHRVVFHAVMKAAEELKFKGGIFSFEIWNPLRFKMRNLPRLVVNISKTFKLRIKSFKKHKSQTLTLISLWWNIYTKPRLAGIMYGKGYAEVFTKVK